MMARTTTRQITKAAMKVPDEKKSSSSELLVVDFFGSQKVRENRQATRNGIMWKERQCIGRIRDSSYRLLFSVVFERK